MNEGYIKLWRKSLESGMMRNPHLWTFWCWCLMKATWKPIKQMVGNQMVELVPGQFVFGRKAASEELETGEKIIRTRLDILKNLGNVTIKPTNKFSIITICNWELYQNNDEENGQQLGQQRANNGPTTGHKQEVKEVKEHKNIPPNPLKGERDRENIDKAKTVLDHLNKATGRSYRAVDSTLKDIKARIKEGATVEDCIRVIDGKKKDQYFIDNPKYLNPETLFRASKFERYRAECADTFIPFEDRKGAEKILKGF